MNTIDIHVCKNPDRNIVIDVPREKETVGIPSREWVNYLATVRKY